ncbi:MAG: cytochrome c oxidase assembly protein [Comamonadaceae bacterium]|nr:MAG: cytochrome c oxidase assembly protein [Comamonadaceae bacterium]
MPISRRWRPAGRRRAGWRRAGCCRWRARRSWCSPASGCAEPTRAIVTVTRADGNAGSRPPGAPGSPGCWRWSRASCPDCRHRGTTRMARSSPSCCSTRCSTWASRWSSRPTPGDAGAPASSPPHAARSWPSRASGGTSARSPASRSCWPCMSPHGWPGWLHEHPLARRRLPGPPGRRTAAVEQLLRRAVRIAVARLRGGLGRLAAPGAAGHMGAASRRAGGAAGLAMARAAGARSRRGQSPRAVGAAGRRACRDGSGAPCHRVDRLAGSGLAPLRRRRVARSTPILVSEGTPMLDHLVSLCLTGVAPALPQGWWLQWSLAPVPLLAVIGLCRFAHRQPAPRRGHAWTGCLLCAIALLSPLCRLGATLAMAHMAQLMVMVAAGALLALGAPPSRRWNAARGLPALTLLHAAVLWGWHVPVVYTAILADAIVHAAAWSLLLGSSFAFWRAVLSAAPTRPLAALLAVLATMAHTGLLGALLTLSGRALYAVQAPGARAWGLAPLADQQVAGLLMWVPGSFAYFAAAVVLSVRMIRAPVNANAAAGGAP